VVLKFSGTFLRRKESVSLDLNVISSKFPFPLIQQVGFRFGFGLFPEFVKIEPNRILLTSTPQLRRRADISNGVFGRVLVQENFCVMSWRSFNSFGLKGSKRYRIDIFH
jgi:hypothetical protein